MPQDFLPSDLRLTRRALLGTIALGAGAGVLGLPSPAFAASTSMLWPNGTTVRPRITSDFGPRIVTIDGASSYHRGTDFTGYSTIRAVAAGSIVHIGWRSGWEKGGYMVWVQHDGFLSRSLHMVDGSAVVSVGQQVAVGAPLGTMGNTGINGGVHHHLEIAPGGGAQVDPVPFIEARVGGTAPTSTGSLEDIMYIRRSSTGEVAIFGGNYRQANGGTTGRHTFGSIDEYNAWRRITTVYNSEVQRLGLPSQNLVAVPPANVADTLGLSEGDWATICGIYGV